MPKTKIGFFSSLLLSCAIFLPSKPSFGGCNKCQNVTLSLLRSINQKTININRNLIKNSCLGTVLLTGPTTITQEGKYTLCNDMVGPIIIATDNVFLHLNNFAIKTPIAGSIQVGAIIIQAGCKNIEINGGRIQGPLEDAIKTKSLSNNNSHFAGIIVAKGARHISLIELDFIHLDTGIVYQGEQEDIISYPICFGCTFYNCLQAIQADWTDDAVFDKLFVQHGQTGLSLNNCSGCLIAESQISDMRLSSEDISGVGIYMLGGGDNEISANNIRDCQNRGIWSIETTGLSVKANDITRIGDSARTAVQTKAITAIEDAAGIDLDITERTVIVANTISNVKAGKTAVGLRDYGTNSIVEQNLLFDVATSDQEGESAGILGMLRPENNGSYDSNTVKDIAGTGIKIDPTSEVVELPEPNVIGNITHQCGYGTGNMISNVVDDLFEVKPASYNYSLDSKDPTFKLTDTLESQANEILESMAWAPNGKYFALASDPDTETRKFYNIYLGSLNKQGKLKIKKKKEVAKIIDQIAWSADSKYLLAIVRNRDENEIRVYQVENYTLEEIQKIKIAATLLGAAWFPYTEEDFQYFAVLCSSNIQIYKRNNNHKFELVATTKVPGRGYLNQNNYIGWVGQGNYIAVAYHTVFHSEYQVDLNIFRFNFKIHSLSLVTLLLNIYSMDWLSVPSKGINGRYCALTTENHIKIYSFNGHTLNLETQIPANTYKGETSITWSPFEKCIAIGGKEFIQLYSLSGWDSENIGLIPGPKINHSSHDDTIQLSWAPAKGLPKGKYIAGIGSKRMDLYRVTNCNP